MSVYCGVCARQLYSAMENDGAFHVAPAFVNGPVPGRITDTCEDCAAKLRSAVATEATRIANAEQPRVLAIRAQLAAWEAERVAWEKERREFEQAWHARKRSP